MPSLGLASWVGTVGVVVPDEPPTHKRAPPTPSLTGGGAPTVKPDAEEIPLIASTLGQSSGLHPSAGSTPDTIALGAPALIFGRQERYESTYQLMCEGLTQPKYHREGKRVFESDSVVGGKPPVRTNLPARLAENMKRLEGTEGTNQVRDQRVGAHMAMLSACGGNW